MIFSDFTNKYPDEKVEIIKSLGVHIGSREHPNHYIRLYQIGSFYAEIFFRKKDNTIWKVGGFEHPVLLQPYLDQIDISLLGL